MSRKKFQEIVKGSYQGGFKKTSKVHIRGGDTVVEDDTADDLVKTKDKFVGLALNPLAQRSTATK
jgi:hypothetical protein